MPFDITAYNYFFHDEVSFFLKGIESDVRLTLCVLTISPLSLPAAETKDSGTPRQDYRATTYLHANLTFGGSQLEKD